MRTYGLMTTLILSAWITVECLFAFTRMEILGIIFVTSIISYLCAFVFLVATRPHKKKKARWEKCGDLEVMLMK